MTRPATGFRIDAALQALPRDVAPGRDLWPGIESRLGLRSSRPSATWLWQAAAAVVLVAVSSLVTASLVRRGSAPVARLPVPAAPARAMPAAFGPEHSLSGEYEVARRQLATQLGERITSLPPSARQKLEANLAEMRRAAEQINAALARQPGDPLLEELLLNTYQDELGVLSSVNQLTSTSAAVTATREEKMQL
jgi:hypothetical protein